ncbi:MAG: N-formylglutamate amidohydrolase [Planctomycetaceae bacterium]|nr:N-formylglutamate amidohydrolase [Planctomycetaceae bacterium]
METALVLSCEHATAAVPARFRSLFQGQQEVLQSHRGWDPGTLDLGKKLASRFQVPLFATKVSRLLIEVNRSLHHRRLFSEFTDSLSAATKQQLIGQYYVPHRTAIERDVRNRMKSGRRVLHVSLHSFTGVWEGVPRTADLGLLYDPQRASERALCDDWKRLLDQKLPHLTVRRNYPYLGRADGLTTALRKLFPATRYMGIELEINQKYPSAGPEWSKIARAVEATLAELLK